MGSHDYNPDDIDILEDREAVRQRPAMYIGGTGSHGLHHLFREIVDNAVDEALNGHADQIGVELHDDNQTITVRDNGRGIPVQSHPRVEQSTMVVVFTVLHAGGKFNDKSYKTSGGLHGVGAAVTNFLSDHLHVKVRRDEITYEVQFDQGVPTSPPRECGTYSKYAEGSGTSVTFRPDPDIFGDYALDSERIREQLEIQTYVNSGLTITFKDGPNGGETYEYHHDEGLNDYFNHLVDGVEGVHKDPIEIRDRLDETSDAPDVEVETILQWTDAREERLKSFVNAIQTESGTHEQGLHRGVKRAIQSYLEQTGGTPQGVDIATQDIYEGLHTVLNVFVEGEIEFEGQTKRAYNDTDIRQRLRALIEQTVQSYLFDHPNQADQIRSRIVKAARARQARRMEEETTSSSDDPRRADIPSKLADCTSQDPARNELFIVEGQSAGGNAKQARDRTHQAVLPLRGKILNTEKNKGVERILRNDEISNIVHTLGCGIGSTFDYSQLKYDTIVLLMDADSDGHHITTLLLGLFYRHFSRLIEEGHVYIAKPPLYQIKQGEDRHWVLSDEEKESTLRRLRQQDGRRSIDVMRFKGLGEMDQRSLRETTLDPDTRSLIQVTVEQADQAESVLSSVLGRSSKDRKKMILSHLDQVADSPHTPF